MQKRPPRAQKPKLTTSQTRLSDRVEAHRVPIKRAERIIRSGGVIAYPTEAVYGLGCHPKDLGAFVRILQIKNRSWEKGMLLVASTIAQVMQYAELPSGQTADQVLNSWPGPTTWLLPVRPDVPPWVTGGRDSIGIRVSAHPVVKMLCDACGTAIVSTSANRSRQTPIRKISVLRRHFQSSVDMIVPGPLGEQNNPSRIFDARNGRLIRAN